LGPNLKRKIVTALHPRQVSAPPGTARSQILQHILVRGEDFSVGAVNLVALTVF